MAKRKLLAPPPKPNPPPPKQQAAGGSKKKKEKGKPGGKPDQTDKSGGAGKMPPPPPIPAGKLTPSQQAAILAEKKKLEDERKKKIAEEIEKNRERNVALASSSGRYHSSTTFTYNLPPDLTGRRTSKSSSSGKSYADSMKGTVLQYVQERTGWLNDTWRRAVYEYVEKKNMLVPDVLKGKVADALVESHLPTSGDEFSLYVVKHTSTGPEPLDNGHFILFKTVLKKRIEMEMLAKRIAETRISDMYMNVNKGCIVVQCVDMYTHDVLSKLINTLKLGNDRCEVATKAGKDKWIIQIIIPYDYDYDSPEALVREIKLNNPDRFDWLQTPTSAPVQGKLTVHWNFEVTEEQASVLETCEILKLTLGWGYVSGINRKRPAALPQDVCYKYRRVRKELEGVIERELPSASAEEVRNQLPSETAQSKFSWEVLTALPQPDDAEEVKAFRRQINEAAPQWRDFEEAAGTDPHDEMYSLTYKAAKAMEERAYTKELYYIKNRSDFKHNRTPPAVQTITMPPHKGKKLPHEEYFAVLDNNYLMDPSNSFKEEMGRQKMMIADNLIRCARRRAWEEMEKKHPGIIAKYSKGRTSASEGTSSEEKEATSSTANEEAMVMEADNAPPLLENASDDPQVTPSPSKQKPDPPERVPVVSLERMDQEQIEAALQNLRDQRSRLDKAATRKHRGTKRTKSRARGSRSKSKSKPRKRIQVIESDSEEEEDTSTTQSGKEVQVQVQVHVEPAQKVPETSTARTAAAASPRGSSASGTKAVASQKTPPADPDAILPAGDEGTAKISEGYKIPKKK